MTNDVLKFSAIVEAISDNISELAELGQDGFKAPLIITCDELAELAGLPIGGPARPQSNDLLWFYAFQIAVYARQMLEQSARIFNQVDDDEFAVRVQSVVDAIDERFHPGETALCVYRKLLFSDIRNAHIQEDGR